LTNVEKYQKTKTAQKLDELPFSIELTVGADRSFCDALLEAIDEAFSSLGESAKIAIFFHLENSMGIRKQEIPFRIDDLQTALEKLFGIGAKYLEILCVKNLHEKLKITYKWEMPRWVVPELTFKEYLRLVKMKFENSNSRLSNRHGACSL
jgi:hypothetical protein